MAWFFLPRILAAAMTLVVLIVLTRILGPTDYGRYNIIMVYGTVGFSGIFAWLAAAMTRFHSAPEFDGKAVAIALGTGLRLSLALVPIAILGYLLLPESFRFVVVLGAIFCLSHAVHEIGLVGLRVYGAGPTFAIMALLRPALGVALVMAFVHMGGGYASALMGMAAGSAVTGIYALWIVYRFSGIAPPNRVALRNFFTFGAPLAVVSSGTMLYALLSQSSLAGLSGLDTVGIFAAALTLSMRAIGMPMSMLSVASAATIFQSFEEHGLEESNRELARHFSLLMLVSVPVAATMIFANDTVTKVVFEGVFQWEVSKHLPLLALAAFLSGVQGCYYDYAFTLARKTDLQLYIMGGLIAVHAAASFGLVWILGPIGASWAALLTAVLGLVTYAYLGNLIRPISLPADEVRTMGLATLVYAPFAILADNMDSIATALLLLTVGGITALVVLYIAGHQGLRIVVGRLPGAQRRWEE
ncbi:lipopolysaccharide biosynthesis protein [Ostreiculturibacter nitratireducens]|uniref:lipopolysaccharide biosynthesis protein n=1 Tax=Ostreiculturibacter nitratireducens TaxID=3075226 RepID=UPI0031B62B78